MVDAEIQAIEVKNGHIHKMVIVNCYRPPASSVSKFIDHLELILDSIGKLNEYELFINGDFNVAYNLKNTPDFKRKKQLKRKYNIEQCITEPTRCRAITRNILDLIFTNSKYIAAVGTEDLNISDHQPVWVVHKKVKTSLSCTSFECRSFLNCDKMAYQAELIGHDWDNSYTIECAKQLWDIWSWLY